jgi:hypothetical protein
VDSEQIFVTAWAIQNQGRGRVFPSILSGAFYHGQDWDRPCPSCTHSSGLYLLLIQTLNENAGPSSPPACRLGDRLELVATMTPYDSLYLSYTHRLPRTPRLLEQSLTNILGNLLSDQHNTLTGRKHFLYINIQVMYIFLVYKYSCCFCGDGDWTQGFVQARQVLYI